MSDKKDSLRCLESTFRGKIIMKFIADSRNEFTWAAPEMKDDFNSSELKPWGIFFFRSFLHLRWAHAKQ